VSLRRWWAHTVSGALLIVQHLIWVGTTIGGIHLLGFMVQELQFFDSIKVKYVLQTVDLILILVFGGILIREFLDMRGRR
jgi:hypothetical protein